MKRIGSLGRPVYAHVYGDMADAAAPIRILYLETKHDVCTPYQTADARHNALVAVRLARRYAENA